MIDNLAGIGAFLIYTGGIVCLGFLIIDSIGEFAWWTLLLIGVFELCLIIGWFTMAKELKPKQPDE